MSYLLCENTIYDKIEQKKRRRRFIMIDSNDKGKTLDEINEEIEQQLLDEKKNPPEEKKKLPAFLSLSALVSFIILSMIIYRIVKLFIQ